MQGHGCRSPWPFFVVTTIGLHKGLHKYRQTYVCHCSFTAWLHPSIYAGFRVNIGAPGGTRTPNRFLRTERIGLSRFPILPSYYLETIDSGQQQDYTGVYTNVITDHQPRSYTMKKVLATVALTVLLVGAGATTTQAKTMKPSPRASSGASSLVAKCMPNTHAWGRYCVPNDPDLRGPKYGR